MPIEPRVVIEDAERVSLVHSVPRFSRTFPIFPSSLTEKKRHDKMIVLRPIILFHTRMPGFIIIFIHPHLSFPGSEFLDRTTH